jgi:50S ribosomal protein L16 3-hydroxylase
MNDNAIFNGEISRERFIRDYWQQRPLLLRGAVDPERLRFPADELAGMACEDGIESRLIRQLGEADWQLQQGPLDEAQFAELPASNWTLLVQDVDKYVPQVADLLDIFDFLPDWRIDDIMISYAVDQGGVGPHTDNYDVFLVQAHGRRRWRLSHNAYGDDQLIPDCPLRVLQRFETHEDWVLEPGDVLYLPPRLAHWGTAEGECMTWSIGMRGPSANELANAWLAHQAEQVATEHFADNLAHKSFAAEIDATEVAATARLIGNLLPQDGPDYRRWLGSYLTEPKPDFEIDPPQNMLSGEQVLQSLASGRILRRHPWARFAKLAIDAQSTALCSQGMCHILPTARETLIDLVCQSRRLDPHTLLAFPDPSALGDWLAQLFNHGLLIFDD